MAAELDPLVADLVGWVEREPRAYADVLDAWRTSCPRLTVWEDALDRGYLSREAVVGKGSFVTVTDAGRAFLRSRYLSTKSLKIQRFLRVADLTW